VGYALTALLGAVFGWWAWKSGAYFATIFYPGAIVLAAVTIALLLWGPAGFRLGGGPALALGGLVALALWTLLSIAWSPTQDAALADAMQVFAYAASFGLGLWVTRLLGRSLVLGLLPVALGAGVAGAITVVTLWSGHDFSAYLHPDASLRFPLGYRNANAAFFLIALWPAVALASSWAVSRWLRPLMLATATVALEIGVLSQSRGSLIALIASVLVFAILCPSRLRVAAYLGLALSPVAVSLPTLLDVYRDGVPIESAMPLLHSAARAMAVSFAAAAALGALAVQLEDRIVLSSPTARRLEAGLVAVVATLALAGSTVYVASHGGPVDFVNQRVEEFRGDTPELHGQGTRFGTNFGSNRKDFWRVAREEGLDNPALGGGSGSFAFSYLRDRRSTESPNDPHSAEMLMLSELGLPGLLLFAVALAGGAVGALRSRARGPQAAALAAAALGAAAYWFTHASFDWFWNYPALTAPAVYLLGAACAPALLDAEARLGKAKRRALALAPALLIAAALPLYLSERYTDDAAAGWRGDLSRAYGDLDRADSLNPFAERPLLVEAEVARLSGDRERALAALRRAVGRQPDNWLPHLLIARLLAAVDPAGATRELEAARRLNPDGPGIK
jgi:hypothetical protein